MNDHFATLHSRLRDWTNLTRAGAVLNWDRQTYMPPGGAAARAEQTAILSRLAHSLLTSDEMGEPIERAAAEVAEAPFDSMEASLIRGLRRDYDRSRRIPAAFVADMRRHSSLSAHIWIQARRNDDVESFLPTLEKTLELRRELAEMLGYEGEPYDALLDQFEQGMRTAEVVAVFDDLKKELVPLVEAISANAGRVDDRVLHQEFDERTQEEFGRMVVARFGYDFNCGRLDRTTHPFASKVGHGDVRITTRFDPRFLNMALFGTMHESGHAMYEQGTGVELEGTPLARGASSTLHESQSRMWENIVGRGLPFWEHFYPILCEHFPRQFAGTDLDTFYRAINRVHPSFIRVEADEVTYPLHLMLRFEMERDLLDGRLPVSDAPRVWKERMHEYLGVTPPNDTLGILQDVHWAEGLFGYFPTYALGTVLSAQLYNAALRDRPEIPEQIRQGSFGALLDWLRLNVHQHGRKYLPSDLIERASGAPLSTAPHVAYLREKYGAIYAL